MPFKRYAGERRHTGRENQESITVARNGFININVAASKHFKGFKFVDLFFDDKTKRVALKPTTEKKEGSYTLLAQPNYDAFKISCKGFLTYLDIPFETTQSFPAGWDTASEMLITEIEAQN